MTPTAELSRKQIRAIFRRAYGSQAEVARIAKVSPVSVSQWLAGKFGSKALEASIREYAARILREEEKRSSNSAA